MATHFPAFHVVAKPIGPICNLDCQYCFYLEKEKLYPSTHRWGMSPDVLESFIRQYIEAQAAPNVSFLWQGGEPTLLGVDYFRQVVALQQRYAGGKQIENALQTNGVLIDDDWAEFLAENQFLVGLSIDGPPEFNDSYRVDKAGRATFDKVIRGLETLNRHRVEFNTLTCVHRQNGDHGLEIYRFLKEVGSGFMQFLPIVERLAHQPTPEGLLRILPDDPAPAEVAPWSVGPLQYGEFLCEIFDDWVRHDVARHYVQIFDVTLENWMGITPSLCVFRKTCGSALAVEHNGDLYSCDHFVYPRYKLGNLMNRELGALVNSPEQVAFGQAKSDTLPRYCQECDVRFACHGECPKHRFTQTPDGEAGLNYLCAGYKHFFRHVAPAMDFMVRELRARRPPANVMAWWDSQERIRFPSPTT